MKNVVLVNFENRKFCLQHTDNVQFEQYFKNKVHTLCGEGKIYESKNGKLIPFICINDILNEGNKEDKINTIIEIVIEKHLEWIEALRISLVNNSPFDKPNHTDCFLGKWITDYLKQYENNVNYLSIVTVINKLFEPHKKIHDLGKILLGMSNKEESLQILKKHKETTLADFLILLRKLPEDLINAHREIIVTFRSKTKNDIALLVDQVGLVIPQGELIIENDCFIIDGITIPILEL